MSDEDDRLKLASLQNRLENLYQLHDRFGRESQSIRDLEAEIAAIPAHIQEEDAYNKKVAALDGAIRAYIVRRRVLKKLPRVDDIWQAVRGFEQQPDPDDIDGSRLIAKSMSELRQLNAGDEVLETIARKADKSV